ncbi:MAG: hypothetical protein ACRDZO_07910 [Egibacteraceae bacterium]
MTSPAVIARGLIAQALDQVERDGEIEDTVTMLLRDALNVLAEHETPSFTR